jgi:hypothetical protein
LHDDVETGEKDIYDNAEKTEDGENKNRQNINNPNINVKSDHTSSNIKTKFDGDADVFDLCGNELKKEISTNIIKANKSEPVEAHVCGPFMNSKTGQGSYYVVFGGLQKAWTLKAPFLCGYLCTLVERMNSRNNTSINVVHCETYYEFNIKKVELRNESVWLFATKRWKTWKHC